MSEFRLTGKEDLSAQVAALPEDMADPAERLRRKIAECVSGSSFNELYKVTLDHDGLLLVGNVMLDKLEEAGFLLEDFDALGALTSAAVPAVSAIIAAAAARGQSVDGFVLDFVYPSVKGTDIAGKRVILVDAWLSQKSYIQTSSLVTLQQGNRLDLDFSVVEHEVAKPIAILSLVGAEEIAKNASSCETASTASDSESGTEAREGTGKNSVIELSNTVTGESCKLPFIYAYGENELN